MTVLLLIARSLRQHALSTWVTALSIALAGGLLMTVWLVRNQARDAFAETSSGFDAVLGARGSKLQLVLNALFHLDASPGNLPSSEYERIRRHPAVATALPVAVGDNFDGWRIVGTVPEMFELQLDGQPRHRLAEGGRVFQPGAHEAVVGSVAAEALGWEVGDHFHPQHGVGESGHDHEEEYVVVGRLEPTNTPADRVIWIPLHGVQTMSGHNPAAADEISAVLLRFRAPTAGMMLDAQVNRPGGELTLAYPVGTVVAGLFNRLGWVERVLALVAYLVAGVAAASVLASIHASLHARRRDIAILRALGARRRTVFGAVVGEAAMIGLLGSVASFAVLALLWVVVAGLLRTQTGVVLDLAPDDPVLWRVPLGLTALAALAGVVPAWRAYRTDVARNLAPES